MNEVQVGLVVLVILVWREWRAYRRRVETRFFEEWVGDLEHGNHLFVNLAAAAVTIPRRGGQQTVMTIRRKSLRWEWRRTGSTEGWNPVHPSEFAVSLEAAYRLFLTQYPARLMKKAARLEADDPDIL